MHNRQRIIVGLSIWLYWVSLYTYMAILPTYARDLGASYQMIGVILGTYGCTQLALRLPLGIVSDRLDRRKVFLVGGAALGLMSSLGMWLVRDVYALFFFRALSGVAATAWVVQSVLFVRCYPPAEAAKAMGVVTAVVTSGEMSSMFIGGLVAQHFGQEQTFLLAALVALPALAVNMAIREQREPSGREPAGLAEIMAMGRNWSLALPSFLGFLVQAITFGAVFGFVPLVAKNLGASFAEIGLLPTVFLLPGVAASVLIGTVFQRVPERFLVAVCFAVMAGGCFVIPYVTDVPTLFVIMVVTGFFRGLVFPILMALSIRGIAQSRQATAMGFFQAIYGLGMFLGPLVVGMLSDLAGMEWGFGSLVLAGVVGAALARAAVAERRPATAEDAGS